MSSSRNDRILKDCFLLILPLYREMGMFLAFMFDSASRLLSLLSYTPVSMALRMFDVCDVCHFLFFSWQVYASLYCVCVCARACVCV